MTDYRYLADEDEEFDPDADSVPFQLALHGVTIADDATPDQAAMALLKRFGSDWLLALPAAVWRIVLDHKAARMPQDVAGPV